ncbi:MAG: thiamine pyrophosphate-dependent enzyme [Jatrophihabitans sp.]|uniref:thiamine pyrophosphate-dependent enzyme n=1 Tax=Jatrophihabitans sp. TaxID=1932789 RepID=UPI003F7E7838
MAASRLIDIHARRLRQTGRGYYTIGSAGHESNAYVAEALRPTDPALLHYRSGGFFLARSRQAGRPLADGVRAVLLGMFAATADPASGGRHKVFGDASLAVIPQTSTIASHLPRAVGVAFAIGRAKKLGRPSAWPTDAVAVTSFGDASANHSTAVGALNTAGYCVAQGLPLPLLIVCEDNGLGISVPTPSGWIGQALQRPNLTYLSADGDDPDGARATAQEAADLVRRTRRPVVLHLRTVRFLGHAGTDVESAYRTAREVAAERGRDPLLALARRIGSRALLERYEAVDDCVTRTAAEVGTEPTLKTAEQVLAPLRFAAPSSSFLPRPGTRPDAAGEPPRDEPSATGAAGVAGQTLAQAINAALAAELAVRPDMLVFGEDVGRKGGVYGLTRGLQQRFGAARVFDTLLDEQSILGLGLGLGVSGLLPVPEIQYLAYVHNAEDQLRGEAASLRFFSGDTYRNPMVVRIAGLAYQKGFGGHFHNDNAVAVLRDIPGLAIAVPSRPEDAAPLLRACLAAAAEYGQVSAYLEPIALYHERDLLTSGDRGWLGAADAPPDPGFGRARRHGDGADLVIVTFGNGVRMSLRAAAQLSAQGIAASVLDLRWLAPLPVEDVLAEAARCGRVLVADETRHSGGVGGGIVTALVEHGFRGPIARVAGRDSFIPLGAAADLVLLGEDDIVAAAQRLASG